MRVFSIVIALLCSAVAACAESLATDSTRRDADRVGSVLYVPSDIYNVGGSPGKPAADKSAADAAYAKASQAAEDGDVSVALHEACCAVALNPDHADARRLLGYQRVGEHWAGAYAQQMLKTGQVWRREFGWIKAADAQKYEQGLRPAGSGWVTAEDDAQRHASIERGWVVRTDHFLITTNVDRAAGADLAVRLETLYQLWRQLFGEFAMTPAELKARLDGKDSSKFASKPFRVIYHRTREEYNAALLQRQPQIGITLGIYFDSDRESHFFAGKDQDPGTIAHEAVHQFFYESAPHATRRLTATANTWAVEGVACYFESLVARGKNEPTRSFTIGTPEAGRIPAARHRRIVDNYYVPLAELAALGVTDLQRREDIARLYSQSAGLASFFMDYNNGVYRKPFRELLLAVYAGRDSADKVVSLTGRSFEQLDAEYLSFMKSLPVTAVLAP